MKIGVLGGTFDPIHLGHLRLAEEAGESLALERVYLIPAASPPHKGDRVITPFTDRMAMTQMAADESPMLEALDIENKRPGLSYTIDTLKALHHRFGKGLDPYFILGVDAFFQIETWKEYQDIFRYTHFVVMQRPGVDSRDLKKFLQSLNVGFEEEQDMFVVPSGHRLITLEATLMDISSTNIRDRVAQGKSIRFLVSERVRDFIYEKGIYRANGAA